MINQRALDAATEIKIEKKKVFTTANICKVAIFGALSFALYMLNFKLPIFPSFLEMNLSDLPALIGGFAMGPVCGALIVIIKIGLKLIFGLSGTGGVGELADLFIGLCFVIPSALAYSRRHSKRGAIEGVALGSVFSILGAILANRLFLVEFYVSFFFKGNWQTLINMCSVVIKSITLDNFYTKYIWLAVIPFNAMRCVVVSVVTFLVYKRLSPLLHRWN